MSNPNINDELHFLKGAIDKICDQLVIIARNQHQTVAAPALSFDSDDAELTISCSTSGAAIHYTTDGSTPTVESDICSAPISISESCTVKAMAVKLDMNDSEVSKIDITITPESGPEGEPQQGGPQLGA